MKNLHILLLTAAILIPFSLKGQNDRIFRVGVDASMDFFLPLGDKIAPSVGLGVLGRVGRYDQWVNFVGGVRYIYGRRLSGFQVPLTVNVNLYRGPKLSAYLGGGYEFDFIGTYWGCTIIQTGLAGRHFDVRIFYKHYQGDLGVRFTYYF